MTDESDISTIIRRAWGRIPEKSKAVAQAAAMLGCDHCAYDRQFPGFESGGWIQQDNNGPIVACPACNNDAASPRH